MSYVGDHSQLQALPYMIYISNISLSIPKLIHVPYTQTSLEVPTIVAFVIELSPTIVMFWVISMSKTTLQLTFIRIKEK